MNNNNYNTCFLTLCFYRLWSGWSNISGKIISIKLNQWFNLEFWKKLAISHNSFIFGEATPSHFFRITITLAQQLLFRSSYFFRAAAYLKEIFLRNVTSLQQLLFQNRYFFREKLLPSSHFLRIGSWRKNYLEWRNLQRSYYFEAGTSAQHQLFQKNYILERANFSEKQYSAKPTFSGELPF